MVLSNTNRQIGTWGLVALLALRLGVGWHFFKEGAKKFTEDGFTSVYFLQAATGPLAEMYKSSIPDRFGLERLDLNGNKQFWDEYKENVAATLSFDNAQTKAADKIVASYGLRMEEYLRGNAEEISEYKLEVKRLRDAMQKNTSAIDFEKERIAKKEAELRGKVSGWLRDVAQLERSLQAELNGLATEAQRSRGTVAIPTRDTPPVDHVVKWIVFGSGCLLLLGLFTRLACVGAGLFLLSVIGSQPPWVAGADPTYNQVIELLALFVLFVFAAGRIAGLDYVIHGLRMRCFPPKTT